MKPPMVPSTSSARIRKIKVGRIYRNHTRNAPGTAVPFIRISGKWLEQAGFRMGSVVTITVQSGELTLTVQNPNLPEVGQTTGCSPNAFQEAERVTRSTPKSIYA